MKNVSVSARWFRGLFLASVAAVLALSVMPAHNLPQTPLLGWDKAQHLLAFAYLAVIGRLAFGAPARLLITLAAFGAFIELVQWATRWRQGDLLDWLADLLGVLLGLAAAHWLAARAR